MQDEGITKDGTFAPFFLSIQSREKRSYSMVVEGASTEYELPAGAMLLSRCERSHSVPGLVAHERIETIGLGCGHPQSLCAPASSAAARHHRHQDSVRRRGWVGVGVAYSLSTSWDAGVSAFPGERCIGLVWHQSVPGLTREGPPADHPASCEAWKPPFGPGPRSHHSGWRLRPCDRAQDIKVPPTLAVATGRQRRIRLEDALAGSAIQVESDAAGLWPSWSHFPSWTRLFGERLWGV